MSFNDNVTSDNIEIVTFYKFVPLNNLEEWKHNILNFCQNNNLKGTILLAEEGINATVAGEVHDMKKFKTFIQDIREFADVDLITKTTFSDSIPFQKMKVRLKNEVVKIMNKDFAIDSADHYIDGADWDDFITKDDVVVIDTRNNYETQFGTFKNAVIPNIDSFHEFPEWFDNFQKQHDLKAKKIAVFCTAGIRTEKAVSYIKHCGFDKVFHIKNGIYGYLQNSKNKSQWMGDCFVFDDRVALDNDLNPIKDINCVNCGQHINTENMINVTKGRVTCYNCIKS